MSPVDNPILQTSRSSKADHYQQEDRVGRELGDNRGGLPAWAVLFKNYLLTKPTSKSQGVVQPVHLDSQPVNSPTVSSLDIDWKQNKQTLILAISSSCHFCTDSAPFYRKIAQSKGNTRLVAVLPQGLDAGRKYLERLGISVDEVRQSGLDKIGVRGTPTLLLIDNSGFVKESWLGKLSSGDEEKVLGFLH